MTDQGRENTQNRVPEGLEAALLELRQRYRVIAALGADASATQLRRDYFDYADGAESRAAEIKPMADHGAIVLPGGDTINRNKGFYNALHYFHMHKSATRIIRLIEEILDMGNGALLERDKDLKARQQDVEQLVAYALYPAAFDNINDLPDLVAADMLTKFYDQNREQLSAYYRKIGGKSLIEKAGQRAISSVTVENFRVSEKAARIEEAVNQQNLISRS